MKKPKIKKAAKTAANSDKSEAIKEILRKIQQAKKIKEKVKTVSEKKPESEAKEKKQAEKPKNIDYQNKAKLDYLRSMLYGASHSIDYEKLFNYMGKEYKDPYKSFMQEIKQTGSNSSELTEEQLERIIRREQTDIMLGKATDRPFTSIEEKEKFKYWKETHRFWNMIKIDMLSVGNGVPGIFYI